MPRSADDTTGTPMSREELAENAQMAISVELLRQNGFVADGDRVQIGHIELTASGVVPAWADTTQHQTVPRRLEQ